MLFSPQFLKIGITLAFFMATGTIPVDKDKLTICTKGYIIPFETCLNNFALILSWPELVFGFSKFIILMISSPSVGNRKKLLFDLTLGKAKFLGDWPMLFARFGPTLT